MKKPTPEESSGKDNPKRCFVIMPIADHPDYESGHFDRVYNHLIKPACILAGYDPVRADDSKASNMIMLDVLRSIIDCDMAICDLSSRNANVFYELGLRQAFDRKTILIRDGKHDVPFDLLGFRYVNYSPSLRVDTVKKEVSDIAEMLSKTDNANINDANSIVSILKMKPAEIDTKNLNAEESLMFELLNRMKRLEGSVNEINSSNSNSKDRIYSSWSYLKQPQKNIVNLDEISTSKTISFDDALDIFGEEAHAVNFTHKGEIIGKYSGTSKNGRLLFTSGNRTVSIANTPESRAEIFLV